MEPVEEALELFRQGFNCAQSVVGALGPSCGLDRETCLRIAAPFGGGLGRRGETCGALAGALMVVGLALGEADPSPEAKDRGYAPAARLVERFRAAHGSLACRDLAGCDMSTPEGLQAYRDRDLHHTLCPRFVGDAVRWAEEELTRRTRPQPG